MCSTRSVPLVLGPLRGLGRLPGRVVTSATGTLACRGHARSPRARERSGSNASVLTRSRRASVPHGGPQRRAGVRGASESQDPLCLGPELGPPGGEQAVLADVSQGLWGQCCCSNKSISSVLGLSLNIYILGLSYILTITQSNLAPLPPSFDSGFHSYVLTMLWAIKYCINISLSQQTKFRTTH